ncbi:MAG: hypothetical protein RL701_4779 [Pseudomonadota bacterium]
MIALTNALYRSRQTYERAVEAMKAICVRSACGVAIIVVSMLGAACSSDNGTMPVNPAGAGAAGQAAAGQSGLAGKTGVAGAAGQVVAGQSGVAGVAAGGAGAAATAGASGAVGSTAGASGSGGAGSSSYATCGPASTKTGSELHAAAAAVLLPTAAANNMGKCSFSACHGANSPKAGVSLVPTTGDLKMLLVDKTACEAPNLKVVASTKGDAALANSWLWQKLVAPADAMTEILPMTSWGTPGSCGQSSGTGYGGRMPWQDTGTLPAESLNAIRDWICAGAPGK